MPRTFDLKSVLSPVQDVIRKLKDRRAVIMDEIGTLEETMDRFMGGKRRKVNQPTGTNEPTNTQTPTPTKSKKRTRRDRKDIEAEVREIVEFIRSAGTLGMTASDIKAKYPIPAPSVKSYLKSYAPRGTFKTQGAKSKMRYFAQ